MAEFAEHVSMSSMGLLGFPFQPCIAACAVRVSQGCNWGWLEGTARRVVRSCNEGCSGVIGGRRGEAEWAAAVSSVGVCRWRT